MKWGELKNPKGVLIFKQTGNQTATAIGQENSLLCLRRHPLTPSVSIVASTVFSTIIHTEVGLSSVYTN